MPSSWTLLTTPPGVVRPVLQSHGRLRTDYTPLVTVDLPANSRVEYKYIRKFNGRVTWESDPNRVINTPASGSITEGDQWR